MQEISVVLIGGKRAGKSALVERFLSDTFQEKYVPTRGTRIDIINVSPVEEEEYFIIKEDVTDDDGDSVSSSEDKKKSKKERFKYFYPDKEVEIKFINTSSNERYNSQMFSAVKDAHLVLIVLDMSEKKESLERKYKAFRDLVESHYKPYIIVGSKMDIASPEQIGRFNAKFKKHCKDFVITSSLTGKGISDLFNVEIHKKYCGLYEGKAFEKFREKKLEFYKKLDNLIEHTHKIFEAGECEYETVKSVISFSKDIKRLSKNYFEGHVDYDRFKSIFDRKYQESKHKFKQNPDIKQKMLDIFQTVTSLGFFACIFNYTTKRKFVFFKLKEDIPDKIAELEAALEASKKYFDVIDQAKQSAQQIDEQRESIKNAKAKFSIRHSHLTDEDSDFVDPVKDTPHPTDTEHSPPRSPHTPREKGKDRDGEEPKAARKLSL